MNVYIRIFAIFNLINGAFMLIAPETWYQTVPGVPETGPYNSHFVRDIGIAFVASSIGIFLSVGNRGHRQLDGAVVGILFLGGHALFHLMLIFMHSPGISAALRDLAMIVAPSALAFVWLIGAWRRNTVIKLATAYAHRTFLHPAYRQENPTNCQITQQQYGHANQ